MAKKKCLKIAICPKCKRSYIGRYRVCDKCADKEMKKDRVGIKMPGDGVFGG